MAKIVSSNFSDCVIAPNEHKDMVQQDARNDPDPYILKFWQPKTSLESGIKKIIKELYE